MADLNEILERAAAGNMPSYADISVAANRLISERDGEWCGIPMPLPGLGLTLEDRYPEHLKLMVAHMHHAIDPEALTRPHRHECSDEDMAWIEVNRWRGHDLRGVPGDIVVAKNTETGKVTWLLDPAAPKRNRMLFGPMDTFDAWHLETELTAMETLSEHLTHRQFSMYVMTGSFMEKSKRSGVHYMFRRCRPTIAITFGGGHAAYFKANALEAEGYGSHDATVLACLCLHPLGYYSGTFGGAMVPTDDVLAHLLLMRGDEHMYWKRANQHHPLSPESGL